MLLDVDPFIFRIGAFGVRWYGLMVVVSIMTGLYYMLKHARRLGFDEDHVYSVAVWAVVGGVIGARLIFVLTNLPTYMADPAAIFRVWEGGLAWHGALLGGLVAAYPVAGRNLYVLADLAVPGLSVGYILVRIANIFNQEVLGRTTELFFVRHPAQIYGSLIGLFLLILNLRLAKVPRPPGWLFWAFIFYYSILRGAVEETFRDNPLYLEVYVNEALGVGFFTLTQLVTPALIVLAWLMMRRSYRAADL